MVTSDKSFKLFLLLILVGLIGCEEQKEQALEFFNKNQVEEIDPSNIERFGFDDEPTAAPTSKKVVVPFDNERTRREAN